MASALATGEVEGIIAPGNGPDHAAGTSALLPMLSLGIPGSATAAVMMGGLMIWGLNPGPMLFVDQKDFVWGADRPRCMSATSLPSCWCCLPFPYSRH